MSKLKLKTCRICKTKFPAYLSTSIVCSIKCAIEHTEKANARLEARRKVIAKREHKQALEAYKRRSDWMQEATREFNRFIRLRDANEPCISCGRYVLDTGHWDCGHFRTVGSSPHMRFVEDNAHKQCSSCNRGSEKYIKKRERVATAYEQSLRARIGNERVDAVKNDNTIRNYTIDDIKQIKETYKAKCKELERIRDGE